MAELVKELEIYGVCTSYSETCCAKAFIYYNSESIRKSPYFKIINALYQNDDNEGFKEKFCENRYFFEDSEIEDENFDEKGGEQDKEFELNENRSGNKGFGGLDC